MSDEERLTQGKRPSPDERITFLQWAFKEPRHLVVGAVAGGGGVLTFLVAIVFIGGVSGSKSAGKSEKVLLLENPFVLLRVPRAEVEDVRGLERVLEQYLGEELEGPSIDYEPGVHQDWYSVGTVSFRGAYDETWSLLVQRGIDGSGDIVYYCAIAVPGGTDVYRGSPQTFSRSSPDVIAELLNRSRAAEAKAWELWARTLGDQKRGGTVPREPSELLVRSLEEMAWGLSQHPREVFQHLSRKALEEARNGDLPTAWGALKILHSYRGPDGSNHGRFGVNESTVAVALERLESELDKAD